MRRIGRLANATVDGTLIPIDRLSAARTGATTPANIAATGSTPTSSPTHTAG
jgi:hypothetical protein